MELQQRLSWLIEAAEQLDMTVRLEHLGGDGGGLCVLKSQRILFVDLDADLKTRYENTLRALADVTNLQDRYIPPIIAEDLDWLSAEGTE